MKSVTAIALIAAILAASAVSAAARQFRGPVHMRGPIQRNRVRMRAPIHAARPSPNYAYNDQARFSEYKRTWGTFSDRYDWSYQFKDVNSTETYRKQGYDSQTTDYRVD